MSAGTDLSEPSWVREEESRTETEEEDENENTRRKDEAKSNDCLQVQKAHSVPAFHY